MKKTHLLLCSIFLYAAAYAQSGFDLVLSSGTYHLPEATTSAAFQQPAEGRYYRYVRFTTLPAEADKEKLQASGIRLVQYIGANTWAASFTDAALKSAASAEKVQFVCDILPQYKMHSELATALRTNSFPVYTVNSNQLIGITFSYYNDLSHAFVMAQLAGTPVTYNNANSRRITAWVKPELIETFVGNPFVCAAELVDDKPVPDNNVERTNHRNNWMAQDFTSGRHYNGAGVSVMLQDDGVIGPHIDYTGRLVQQYITFNFGDHGDHCAGIIMGGGNKDPMTRGNGWGANLYVYEASPYQGYDSIYNHYTSNGIVITSTSYSDGCNAGYTTLAQTLDQQTWDMPSLIHVFSAGNMGTSDCGYGAGSAWGNITGGHKHSKNSIAVGNLTYMDQIASSSSRGPVHDGRMKPEVCAVGTNVYSTIDANDYDYKTGTSMSCPAVSGTFSSLYHAYKTLNGNVNPPSGLMKAILMNTCDDLGNAGPDYIYGYGRINGRKAIQPVEQQTYVQGTVSNSGTNTHTINVPSGIGELKVMLYWHDYPAAVNAAVALVNNLNMQVVNPANTVFNPWILDYTPNASNLNAVAVRGTDIRNNHEQVTIANPAAGNYTVTVNGAAVPQGPQTYYLVWYFEPASELVLTYPNGGEGFAPNDIETIRWDAQSSSAGFGLEYTTDNGMNWTSIATGIPATQRYYNWTPPAALSGECRVRVTQNSLSDQSDMNFTIIGITPAINVIWACPDSLLLKWTPVAGATGYDVFQLGSMYMDSIATTGVDSFVVQNLNNLTNTYWFSVRARGPQSAVGRRAIAIEKLPGAFCPAAIDASVTDVSGIPNSANSCMNNTGFPVIIVLENPGLNAISNVPVSFSINNGPAVNETYAGTVAAFSTATYTFTATASFSTPGVNTLKAWATYNGDPFAWNDTSMTTFTIPNFPAATLPWTEDFESFTLCSSNSDCGATVCPMTNGLTNLENGNDDDVDWRTFEGNTPSNNTGPSDDFMPGTATGNYVYLEASGSCNQQEAYLLTRCIDLTGALNPELSFGYHLYGAGMGSIHVDLYSGGAWINDIFQASGNLGNQWNAAQVSLGAYIGQVITLRFRGITGISSTSDLAIDGISVSEAVGVNEPNAITQVNVFPNPGNGLFRLQVSGLQQVPVTTTVYDVTGRKLQQTGHGNVTGMLNTTLDLTAFAAGTYYLEVTAGEQKKTVVLHKAD